MKTIGLSKMGMNSTEFYKNLFEKIDDKHNFSVETVNFNHNYDYILLDGGSDVSPILYNEDNTKSYTDYYRDNYEVAIYNHYKNTSTKFSGICRGLQLLNVMRGGTLYQNLCDYNLAHGGNHYIEVCFPELKFLPHLTLVNSLHHQGIKTLGNGLIPMAYELKTRVIEIIGEVDDKIRAVQFHPEWLGAFSSTKDVLRWLFWIY